MANIATTNYGTSIGQNLRQKKPMTTICYLLTQKARGMLARSYSRK